MAVTWEA